MPLRRGGGNKPYTARDLERITDSKVGKTPPGHQSMTGGLTGKSEHPAWPAKTANPAHVPLSGKRLAPDSGLFNLMQSIVNQTFVTIHRMGDEKNFIKLHYISRQARAVT
jgi:hypothetical protein